jgi:hypothetical protein
MSGRVTQQHGSFGGLAAAGIGSHPRQVPVPVEILVPAVGVNCSVPCCIPHFLCWQALFQLRPSGLGKSLHSNKAWGSIAVASMGIGTSNTAVV